MQIACLTDFTGSNAKHTLYYVNRIKKAVQKNPELKSKLSFAVADK